MQKLPRHGRKSDFVWPLKFLRCIQAGKDACLEIQEVHCQQSRAEGKGQVTCKAPVNRSSTANIKGNAFFVGESEASVKGWRHFWQCFFECVFLNEIVLLGFVEGGFIYPRLGLTYLRRRLRRQALGSSSRWSSKAFRSRHPPPRAGSAGPRLGFRSAIGVGDFYSIYFMF